MQIFKRLGIAFFAIILFTGCDAPEVTQLGPKQAWKKGDYLNSRQIVFTNAYGFKDGRSTTGASSFFVQGKKGPVLCTAKHLLGAAMGITPTVETSDFNAKMDFWKVYARNDALFADTLSVSGIVSSNPDFSDIIVLNCSFEKNEKLLALKPRFSRVNVGEELEIIGCEYGDPSGMQKSFKVFHEEYDGGKLIVKSKTKFVATEMSGSPVVDASGYVVGVLVGGSAFQGNMYLSVDPLTRVKKYL